VLRILPIPAWSDGSDHDGGDFVPRLKAFVSTNDTATSVEFPQQSWRTLVLCHSLEFKSPGCLLYYRLTIGSV